MQRTDTHDKQINLNIFLNPLYVLYWVNEVRRFGVLCNSEVSIRRVSLEVQIKQSC